MAAVKSTGSRIRNRLAIAAVLVVTLIFLAPIYWIASTAFKPRDVATSVPPTVFFEPELTPFAKLFTRRVQLREPPAPEVYAAAPWWEQSIYDDGERVLRVQGEPQLSQYPSRFLNSLIVAIVSTLLAVGMGTLTAYGFSRFKVAGENDWLFFILSTRMLPPVVVAIPMFLMYRAVGMTDTHVGLIILYTAFNLSFSVWLMKGLHGRDPEGVRGGGAGRRLHADAGLLEDRAARGGHRHRRDRGLLLHHRLERVRLRADDDQPPRPDRAAVHPGAGRLRAGRLDDDRGGHRSSSCCRSRSSPSRCATTCCAA